ncbi:hypothetical protein KBC75_02130 [Candidatus Shapirobacteria bacterium]|nr:hypothetical protein [Candidatus Shapirobacteria bacterium]
MKRVKAKWIMKLPTTAKLRVRMGEYVGREDVLAEAVEYRHKSIDMSKALHKQTEDVISRLKSRLPVEVKAGEVLVERVGFFGSRLVSPETGLLLRVDEFNNFIYRWETDGIKLIKTPVPGRIVKCDKTGLAIEFHAKQFNGEGRGSGKKWAEGMVVVGGLSEINSSLKDKLIIIENLDKMVVIKSEVVGVAGFILRNYAEVATELPLFMPDKNEYEKILALEKAGDKQVLLNSSDGRLMIVQ